MGIVYVRYVKDGPRIFVNAPYVLCFGVVSCTIFRAVFGGNHVLSYDLLWVLVAGCFFFVISCGLVRDHIGSGGNVI